jgi:TPR repeat protein
MFGWFKKKITIQISEERSVKIREAQVDKLIREGQLKRVVEVIVDDIDEGEKTIHWVVGEEVDRETYENLKDEKGRLHVVNFYRDGKKEAYITTKEHYEGARAAVTTMMSEPNNLRLLAESGDASAQTSLALLYSDGKGVSQDDVEAVKWFRRAAGQGYAVAQTCLGMAYSRGLGVSQDLVLAYMWCSLAAMRGNELAVVGRDHAANQMTPIQIADAEKLAREWKPVANESVVPQ